MLSFGALAFLNPVLLVGLLALPVLWFLLRAVPPGPARLKFPGVRLLLGLKDPERMPERTPWWLLMLRCLAVAAAIFGFADPVLNPRAPIGGSGPVLIVLDGGWASAPDWAARQARVRELLDQAGRAGRPVALLSLGDPIPPEATLDLRPAADWAGRIEAMQPQPWEADRAGWADWLTRAAAGAGGLESWYLADGLAALDPEATTDIAATLAGLGPLTLIGPERLALGLMPARLEDGLLKADVIRAPGAGDRLLQVIAIGTDPNGRERRLASADLVLTEGAEGATASFDLPLELRNRITRLTLSGEMSAGAVTLTDAAIRRRKVGLLSSHQDAEALELVSPLHFLRQALVPSAEVIEAPLETMIETGPDVIILADVGSFSEAERAALTTWVRAGGLLVRFAGPRVAAATREAGAAEADDPLLPVRLRAGGRNVGGAMSWGAPKTLNPFPPTSPFAGLMVPAEVTVQRQVMAQPDPDLPDRILAALDDGTPLVTARGEGEGRVVLFHVTANAEWSNLPISGLFVQMLERLAISARVGAADTAEIAAAVWTPVLLLDGFGRPVDATGLAGVPGARLAEARPAADAPPGLYRADARTVAINLIGADSRLAPAPPPPPGSVIEKLGFAVETGLKSAFLLAGLALIAIDLIATLWLAGRLPGRAMRGAVTVLALLVATALAPEGAQAQTDDEKAMEATRNTVLAYVETGDARVDRVSAAGLYGLSEMLRARTAIEPGPPMAVNIETDELAFYPMLYWPISEGQDVPSATAVSRLNAYLRSGGMIVFDTRDAGIAIGSGSGTGTPNGKVLQRIAAALDIPPLEPVPADHVLTRTFYLLQTFPGRYADGTVWVEAAEAVEEVEGMPFRNLNDGVTPVVVGSNDWAAAWAMDEAGRPLFPVGRTLGGERQREVAWRFGINLVMNVMTGNYKSDQVHVPALLERLGQ